MSLNKVVSIPSLRSRAYKLIALAAAVGTAALYLAAPAHADPVVPQIKISYQDLDLNRTQDVQRLYTRLQQASKSVCRSQDGREPRQHMLFNQCYREALGNAVDQANLVQLSQLHASHDRMRAARPAKMPSAG